MQDRPRRAPLFISFYWLPLKIDWVKLITDGMAQGTPGKVAAVDVFSDHKGVVIDAHCFDVGIGTTFLV